MILDLAKYSHLLHVLAYICHIIINFVSKITFLMSTNELGHIFNFVSLVAILKSKMAATDAVFLLILLYIANPLESF